ncbi:hypothetical protein [Pedobacter paludis]|uniref:DUF4440 domain-containing protein n=1 Tax=Pedobacter paludis TaxID=2203212 RepID=A0A317EZH4_9SPHI|nr:hypothetical protein [Pedobacter paludis]PWS32311.1 hypothetical protein DF947_11135 [Pedobacter paludis]
MEIDSIISTVNEVHKKADRALENRDANLYMQYFDESLKYANADASSFDKKEFAQNLEKYFKSIKDYKTSHYRIKSSFENDIFTEKIARKSVIIKPNLLVFSKKETIQTEEVYHWKNINGEWKIVAVEVVLEEKY